MNLSDTNVTITVPKWRMAAAHVLLFAALIFGAGASDLVWRNIGAFLARGAKVEFIAG